MALEAFFCRKEENFKGKRAMKISNDRKPFKSKEKVKGENIVNYECKKQGHTKRDCPSLKRKKNWKRRNKH